MQRVSLSALAKGQAEISNALNHPKSSRCFHLNAQADQKLTFLFLQLNTRPKLGVKKD